MLTPHGNDWETFPMVAILVALDESESDKEKYPAVSVGGFIATGLQWTNFGNAWNAILDEEGIGIFHAVELETEYARTGTVYEGWPRERREALQTKLLNAIKSNLYRDIGIGLTRNVYNQVMTGDRPARMGDVYLFAALLTMLNAIGYSHYHFGVAPSFLVERGGPYVGKLHEAHDRLCDSREFREVLNGTAFIEGNKNRKWPHLQAADYLVFNASKGISHLLDFPIKPANLPRVHEGQDIRSFRYPLQELYRNFGSLHFAKIDATKLEKIVQHMEEAFLLYS